MGSIAPHTHHAALAIHAALYMPCRSQVLTFKGLHILAAAPAPWVLTRGKGAASVASEGTVTHLARCITASANYMVNNFFVGFAVHGMSTQERVRPWSRDTSGTIRSSIA